MRFKKNQIFLLDLIFSIVILIVTIGILLSYVLFVTNNENIYDFNLQVLDAYTQTKINSLNDVEIRNMFKNPLISRKINVENSVAQQVVQFIFLGETELAKNLTRIFMKSYSKIEYSINITIYNQTNSIEIYSNTRYKSKEFKNSKISSSIRRGVFGFVNKTTSYQDYFVEIKIWQ